VLERSATRDHAGELVAVVDVHRASEGRLQGGLPVRQLVHRLLEDMSRRLDVSQAPTLSLRRRFTPERSIV